VDQLKQTAIENPAFFAPNVWPSSSIPELEDAFKDMGLLICHVGRILARLCDDYVATQVITMAKHFYLQSFPLNHY